MFEKRRELLCACACIHACVRACVRVCMCTCVCKCTRACVRAYVHVCGIRACVGVYACKRRYCCLRVVCGRYSLPVVGLEPLSTSFFRVLVQDLGSGFKFRVYSSK